MQVEYFVVDAFTRKRFGGNNAAIVELENWLSDGLMQQIAIENNLSETAFLKPIGNNHYEIRWFSPITEIDFCGHATLAAAYVLFNHKGNSGEIKVLKVIERIQGALSGLVENTARRSARQFGRRSALAKMGGVMVGGAAFSALPFDRAWGATPAAGDGTYDDKSCDYWRYCALDGFLCTTSGGSKSRS